jgi:signal transduction histidine kinase
VTFGAARWADNRAIQPFKEIREDGITYNVARTGQRIVIPDVNSHPLFETWKWGGAIIGLPLSRAEKVIGVMTVAFEQPHRFTVDELRILDLLADQVAIAIDNANLYASETTEKRNTAALAASARDLSAVLNQDLILQLTLDRLIEVVPYDRASLALINNGRPYFAAERGFNERQEFLTFREKIGGLFPLEKELLKSRLPIIINDVVEDERWKPGDTNRRVRSWLGVPLITGDQTIGFLMLDKYEPRFFTESSAALAWAFAAHAAIALQNAQLFENERRQTHQLEGLHQLSTRISAQLDIKTLLETTAKYAIDLLGGKSGGLYLYRPEREVLEWSVAFGESMVPMGNTLQKGEGLSGKVWEQGKTLVIRDYRNWEGRAKHYEGYPWTSVIGAPISRGGSFYGVLNVLTDEVDAFSESDQKVLDLFTTQAAIALENAQLFDSVTLQNDQLRELAAQLGALEEMERKRLAQELHDRVGQNLTALSINLNMVKSFLPAEVADTLGNRIDDSQTLVGETAQHIRDVMAELRPPVLDDYGLLAALRWYGERFTNRTGVHVSIAGDDIFPRLELSLETTLFRIAQEALTNISRHAEADNVWIKLTDYSGDTQFIITDDGKGFNAAEHSHEKDRPGWGLQIMRERIEAIGGKFKIETPSTGGTILRVTVHGKQV